MISMQGYRNSFVAALVLHCSLIFMLLADTSSQRPVLTREVKNTPGVEQLQAATVPQQEVIKAVSVDNKEIMDTVNRLKQERAQQQRAEQNRQSELNRQLALAKQQRIKEQQHIEKLKQEANKIAILRKKQAEEEKKHLKELAEEKAKEAKRIEELKKQKEQLVKEQELEAKKLVELNKKKLEANNKAVKLKEEKTRENLVNEEKARAALAKADMERKKQAEAAAAALQAQQNAENQARLAGVVDKYKALIVNAIGRNWILPENVDSSLSSQFRIHLAPDGMVMDVTLTRSSGDPLLDRSAQTAIYKASPLPVPADAQTFNLFRDISLTVRPEHVKG